MCQKSLTGPSGACQPFLTGTRERGRDARGPASGTAVPDWYRPPSGIPARGTGTRPPFAPGNALNLRTGVRSPRVYLPLAAELAEGLLTDHPELAQLFSRFREGQISLDQFISEADGKLRLMRLEDE